MEGGASCGPVGPALLPPLVDERPGFVVRLAPTEKVHRGGEAARAHGLMPAADGAACLPPPPLVRSAQRGSQERPVQLTHLLVGHAGSALEVVILPDVPLDAIVTVLRPARLVVGRLQKRLDARSRIGGVAPERILQPLARGAADLGRGLRGQLHLECRWQGKAFEGPEELHESGGRGGFALGCPCLEGDGVAGGYGPDDVTVATGVGGIAKGEVARVEREHVAVGVDAAEADAARRGDRGAGRDEVSLGASGL